MLWTLLKIVLFMGVVVAGAWGVGLLMETEGGIRVSLAGTEFTSLNRRVIRKRQQRPIKAC